MEKMLTVKEVAGRLTISERLVRRYITIGTSLSPYINRKLKACKLGREWRVSYNDLQTFINTDGK